MSLLVRPMALLSLFLVAHFAEARSFYKAEFKVAVQYANIDSGSTLLVDDRVVEVQYSDDHEFCRIKLGTETYVCDPYHPDEAPNETMISLDREIAAALLHDAIKESQPPAPPAPAPCKPSCRKKCPKKPKPSPKGPDYLAKFDRLASFLLDPINLEVGSEFEQQLHDRESESFEVWLGELSEGAKY